MAKQKQRAEQLRMGGQVIRVGSGSDLNASAIREIVRHRADLSAGAFWVERGADFRAASGVRLEGVRRVSADDLNSDWVPRNKALAAAFRAKGLTQ